MKITVILLILSSLLVALAASDASGEPKRRRAREMGVRIGDMTPGRLDAITDVDGVKVGHLTLKEGDTIRTGVTVVLPHGGNLFQEKVPGAIYVANGYGKLAGFTQVEEVGTIETPIALTNTLSVGAVVEGLIRYALAQPGNEQTQSVNAVVGEINDGYLNDIRGLHVRPNHVLAAIKGARGGLVEEGSVGVGHGARAMGWKSGVGTSSRVLEAKDGGYTVGVLAVSNFGGSLVVSGVPAGRLLRNRNPETPASAEKGSCMFVVATDAPVDAKSLRRIAERAIFGLARVGSSGSNRSGDYVIAFTTDASLRVKEGASLVGGAVLESNQLNPLFTATMEATEEALLNSIFMAVSVTGRAGHRIESIPLDDLARILTDYHVARP